MPGYTILSPLIFHFNYWFDAVGW